MRLVGALGRDQTYVSTGNPTHRKGNGRRGGGREQEIPEDTCGSGRVGVEASGAAPKGQGKTQRDLILDAVEALEALLGQGVGTPRLLRLLSQAPRLNWSVPSTLLGDKAKLDKSIQEWEEKVSNACAG